MLDGILVLCTGNICRSPMAAALLQAQWSGRAGAPEIASAGLAALVDRPADPVAIALMADRDIDITDHRARQVDDGMLHRAGLVLVMERRQQEMVEARWPEIRGRVHRWGRWQDQDVVDPYRLGRQAFEAALDQIDAGLAAWLPRIETLQERTV